MRTIGWSLFLACSWTWCIGMFLPVLVLRDYGWPGFIVFAIPNVIGCSAFAYLFRNKESAAGFLQRHLSAARLFSMVTIAFHLYFIPMMLLTQRNIPENTHPTVDSVLIITVIVLAAAYLFSRLSWKAWLYVGALVYTASILFLIATLSTGQQFIYSGSSIPGLIQLLPLLLVSVFGFALCPYLDLTFHKAYQLSPDPRKSFTGFGLFFTVMILFTTVYAVTGISSLIVVHILFQSAFTMGAHIKVLSEKSGQETNRVDKFLLPVAIGSILLGVIPFAQHKPEFIYQFFMTMYGLVFPAYVWIIASPRPLVAPNRRGVLAAAIFVIISMPEFYTAFILQINWPIFIPFLLLLLWTGITWSQRGKHPLHRPA